jgi:MFS family permease
LGDEAVRNDLGTVWADHVDGEGCDLGGADVSRRTAARLGWSLFGLSALLLGVAFLLSLRRPQYSDLLATTGELLFGLVIVLSFGWFGALIVARQPRQPIGWILCALAGTIALTFFANEYAIYGLITDPGAVPGAAAVAWFATWAFAIPLGLLAALLLLFPTGRPPSPRWRWWLWVAGVGNLLFILSHLSYWPLRGAGLLRLDISDPAGLPGVLYTIGATAGPVAVVAAGVSVLVRFRRAQGAERQQIKWLLYAVLTAILGYPLLVVVMTALGYSSELAGDVSVSLLVAPIPLAMGLAILRFRLYDIDRLINRTLVYGLLTATLGLAYAGAVLIFGQAFGGVTQDPPSWAVAGATLAVAALFQPARRRIQAVVDRRFNRRKYNAAKTIEAFSARLRDEIDLDTLSAELLAVAHQTMQPTMAALWLRPWHLAGRVVKDTQAEQVQRSLTPCMPYTDLRPHDGQYSCRAAVPTIRW